MQRRRFHQFPVYPSLRLRIFSIFQCVVSADIDHRLRYHGSKVSIDGFYYFLVTVDYRSRHNSSCALTRTINK